MNRLAHLEPDDQATEGSTRCLVHVATLRGEVSTTCRHDPPGDGIGLDNDGATKPTTAARAG